MLASLGFALAAHAQPAPSPQLPTGEEALIEGVVRYFAIVGPADMDLVAKRNQLEVLLRDWGLTVSNCDYLRDLDADLDALIHERYPTWRSDLNLVTDKSILSAQCQPAQDEATFYIAKFTLEEDQEYGGQKRATLQLLPIGDGTQDAPEYVGGYAHRPFVENESWNTVVARAVARGIGGFNEPPAVHVQGDRKKRIGTLAVINAEDSWDPDGDPFELLWTVSVPACIPDGTKDNAQLLPYFGWCPKGTAAGDHEVRMQAGSTGRERTFQPPIIGEYSVSVTPVRGPQSGRGAGRRTWWSANRAGTTTSSSTSTRSRWPKDS